MSRRPTLGAAARGRRAFLTDLARTACGVGLVGLGLGLYTGRAASLPAWAIRPPGARPEADFDGACIRCGLCVRACPFDMLHLAHPGEGLPTGTPYFIARQAACEMCEDLPCVAACPTGALDPSLTNIDDADMGLAVLIDQESCIAFQGLRCEVCFNSCPVKGQAITLDYQRNNRSGKHALLIPVVHADACTGCGKCEEVCILDAAAIRVLPRHLAKGQLGAHYRLGWEQRDQAGGALVTPDRAHRYNLPDGMRYEHGGAGLIDDRPAPEPAPAGALETLNRRGPL